MQYKSENKIPNDILNKELNEEELLRRTAIAFVEESPLETIKKLFNLRVIYGNKISLEEAMKKGDYDDVKLIN